MYEFFSVSNFLPIALGFIVIIFLLILSIRVLYQLIKNKEKSISDIFLYVCFTCLAIGCLTVFITNSLDLYSQYKAFVKPYMNGEYSVVEGVVEEYKSDDYHRETSFYIDDVYFEYTQYELNNLGFTSQNDYIYEGNYLTIEYVYVDSIDSNIIMKIESSTQDISK